MATYRDAEEMLDKLAFYLARHKAAELWLMDTDIRILQQVEQAFPDHQFLGGRGDRQTVPFGAPRAESTPRPHAGARLPGRG